MRALPAAYDLSGRVALVTGAGSPDGIGFATARLLGELGARVAVTATTDRVDERVSDLIDAGVEAVGLVADLTDPELVSGVLEEVRATLGAPTIVVANAGMTSVVSPGSSARSKRARGRPSRWAMSFSDPRRTATRSGP